MNKGCFFILLLLLFGVSCTKTRPYTPIEKNNYKKITSNNEIINFLKEVSGNSEISYRIVDTTIQNRLIALVKISSNNNTKEKTPVLFIAQQHGNEPSGKEGMLLLINDFANGKYHDWLNKFDLYVIPQVNPDGGDLNQRRNAAGIDLNRDHLILHSIEAKAVQNIFDTLRPYVTVDFHEYYPYSDSWIKFGYRKNFDEQFGGLTNININKNIRGYFYTDIFNEVKKYVKDKGFSFFEYTLGNYSFGESLRHSTVDINDGRQSFGICNTMSFIVEGINGRDSVDNIKRRAHGQYETAKGILNVIYKHSDEINEIVANARKYNFRSDSSEKVSIRMNHIKGDEDLLYPLLSIKTNKDTIFKVSNYHSKVVSKLDVKVPKAYLIPKSDKKLVAWLKRSNFKFTEYNLTKMSHIFCYKIVDLTKSIDEELENYYPVVEKVKVNPGDLTDDYYYVSTNQFYKYKIVTALEPQAMYGLINYPDFGYLLFDKYFKILRLEY